MNTKTIFVALSQFCENDDRPRQVLKDAGFRVIENKTGRRVKGEEMADLLKEADAVLAAVEPYDAELLSQLPKLRLISRCGIGTDAVDLEAAKKQGIEVRVTVDEVIEPVAQMTLAMILGLARNFALHGNDFQKGEWKKHTGFLLSEWTVGLVGFGRIARKTAEYLQSFGCKILVTDPFLATTAVPSHITLCSFEDLLRQSDVVSLHLSRSPKEGPLLGANEFEKMKRGSFLVNTARGYLVDEKALEQALQEKKLAGAALDVFEEEPYTGPLTKHPSVLSTPHVATLTRGSRVAMEYRAALNIVEFFKK